MAEPTHLPLRLVVLSTSLALVAAVATYVVLDDDETTARPAVELTPSEDLPELTEVAFTTYDGEQVPMASLLGSPTVVNFFASTCAPCVKEMPAIEEVHQAFSSQVAFLGLAVQDRPEDAQDLVEQTGVTYRTALDKDGSVLNALEGILLPTTVLLDADGEVVALHTGELTAHDLRTLVVESFDLAP